MSVVVERNLILLGAPGAPSRIKLRSAIAIYARCLTARPRMRGPFGPVKPS